MTVTRFQSRIYEYLSRSVPRGKVTTYGALAKALKTSPRAVGQAMRRNPYAPKVPCHRVIASDGSIGGFKGRKAGKAILEKTALLRKEGVRLADGAVAESHILRKL